jgi:hypothetical protein
MFTLQTKKTTLPIVALIVTAVLFGSSCLKTQTAMVESAPAYQPSPVTTTLNMPKVVAPKLADVQEAVARVFKDGAVIDPSVNPNFFVGDFNGDTAQDLAVVLKPATGKVAELNQEFPPWLLRDPFSVDRRERSELSVQPDDILLAIIHGYGDNDWRDTQATQTFLLKNAVGSSISVKTGRDFAQEHSGKRLPRPQGDLIGESLRGVNGYLYYANSNYEWYDPKTFKPRSDIGMVHGASSRIRN